VWYRFAQSKRDEYLKNIGIDDSIIAFINSNPDKANAIVSIVRKNPSVTIDEILEITAPKQKQIHKTQLEADQWRDKLERRFPIFDEKFKNWYIIQALKKFKANPEYRENLKQIFETGSNVRELYDFQKSQLQDNPRFDLNSYSLDQIEKMSHDWHEAIASEGSGKFYLPSKPENTIYTFENGWRLVNVTNENDLDVEGNLMNHCVGSYADEVADEKIKILSLRDLSNRPHVTIEISPDMKQVKQIQGANNHNPKPEYKELLKEYFSNTETAFEEDQTISEKVDDLYWGNPREYDEELEKILKEEGQERDDYGFLKRSADDDVDFTGIISSVEDTVAGSNSRRYFYHYRYDLANTLVDYAYRKDIEFLEKLNSSNTKIPDSPWGNLSKLREIEKYAENTLSEFYDSYDYNFDYCSQPYPQEEDFESTEEYNDAIEKYQEACQEEENSAFNDAVSENPKADFALKISEIVDLHKKDKDFIKLQNEVFSKAAVQGNYHFSNYYS